MWYFRRSGNTQNSLDEHFIFFYCAFLVLLLWPLRELGLWNNKTFATKYLQFTQMCVNKNLSFLSHRTRTVEHRQNIQMISSTHVKNEPHHIKHEQNRKKKKLEKRIKKKKRKEISNKVCMQMRIYRCIKSM